MIRVACARNRSSDATVVAGRLGSAWALGLALALAIGAGCGQSAPESVLAGERSNLPKQAQPRLPTVKLWLGPHELTAEVARNERERSAGMMFRTNIAESEAMLFVFPYAARVSFWMKNVPIPLSCAYVNGEGVIVELHELKPHDETAVVAESREVQFVIETAQGWFERNQVGVGTLVRTERGSLRETFFGRTPAGGER